MRIEDRLQLNEGEKINFIKKYQSRCNASVCRYFYEILNSNGEKVGSVVYKKESDHDKEEIINYTIKQYNLNDNLIFKAQWGKSITDKYIPDHQKFNRLNELKKILRTGTKPLKHRFEM